MPDNSSDIITEAHGLEAVKSALLRRSVGQRSLSWLSRELGMSRGAASHWENIPADHLERIVELTGVPARLLRPDLAKLFAEA